MSKNWQKLVFFQQKKIANGNFLKKLKFLANFLKKLSSFWQFFDIQMAIFRRVRLARCLSTLSCLSSSELSSLSQWREFCDVITMFVQMYTIVRKHYIYIEYTEIIYIIYDTIYLNYWCRQCKYYIIQVVEINTLVYELVSWQDLLYFWHTL